MNVVCQSSRNGVKPDLIVIHDTESLNIPDSDQDLKNIGHYFDQLSTQASSHVCVDAEARSAQYVPDDRKAWSCAQFNSRSLNIEQIGKANQTFWPDAQVKKAAKYVAYWSKKYGIPIDEAHVVTHHSLGLPGGGHVDPGPAYPMATLRRHARYYLRRGWIH